MQIDEIRIENFGLIKHFKAEFCSKLNVICSETRGDILAILGMATGSRVVGFNFTRHVFMPNTRIYAAISGNFGSAEVELFYDRDAVHGCAGNVTLNGKPSSFDELRVAAGAELEREECAVFINEHDYRRYMPFTEYDFTRKLNSYLKYAPQSSSQYIMGTPQFKEVLRKFICSFERVPVNSSKDIWLSVTDDGVFVPLWHGRERLDLSASERAVFNYLCFVEVNAFWGQVARVCNLKDSLPLFIGDFMRYIDRATDIAPLISRALSLGRQTFLFCGNNDIATAFTDDENIKMFGF